jgi:hypothetical protein
MMPKSPTDREQVFINIAGGFSDIIYSHLKKAINSSVMGDWGTWFKNLEAIQETIFMMLEPQEQNVLDVLYGRCVGGYSSWNKWRGFSSIGHTSSKELELQVIKFYKNCKLFQRVLMKNLKVIGFFPTREQLSEVKLD